MRQDSQENQLTNGRVVMGERFYMLNRMPLLLEPPIAVTCSGLTKIPRPILLISLALTKRFNIWRILSVETNCLSALDGKGWPAGS